MIKYIASSFGTHISFADVSQGLTKFFQTTLETLLRQIDLKTPKPVLLASPGFTAASFQKYILDAAASTGNKDLLTYKSNFIVIHSSSGHLHSLNEVLKSPEAISRLKDTKYAR